jgi:hypothetical protein
MPIFGKKTDFVVDILLFNNNKAKNSVLVKFELNGVIRFLDLSLNPESNLIKFMPQRIEMFGGEAFIDGQPKKAVAYLTTADPGTVLTAGGPRLNITVENWSGIEVE